MGGMQGGGEERKKKRSLCGMNYQPICQKTPKRSPQKFSKKVLIRKKKAGLLGGEEPPVTWGEGKKGS